MAAGPFVQAPEPGRLSERQPQSGHFKELRAYSADQFVHKSHLRMWRAKCSPRKACDMAAPEIAALIGEFDRCRDGRVTRTREVLCVADETRKE